MSLLTKKTKFIRNKLRFTRTCLTHSLKEFSLHTWKYILSCLMVVAPDDNIPYERTHHKKQDDRKEMTLFEKLEQLNLIVSKLEKKKKSLNDKAEVILPEVMRILKFVDDEANYLETHGSLLEKAAKQAFGSYFIDSSVPSSCTSVGSSGQDSTKSCTIFSRLFKN